jgi:hypothetical protein
MQLRSPVDPESAPWATTPINTTSTSSLAPISDPDVLFAQNEHADSAPN